MKEKIQPHAIYACYVPITDELKCRIIWPNIPYQFSYMQQSWQAEDKLQKLIQELLVPQSTTATVHIVRTFDADHATINFYYFCQGARPSRHFHYKPEGAKIARIEIGISEPDGSLYVI